MTLTEREIESIEIKCYNYYRNMLLVSLEYLSEDSIEKETVISFEEKELKAYLIKNGHLEYCENQEAGKYIFKRLEDFVVNELKTDWKLIDSFVKYQLNQYSNILTYLKKA